jgi:hypothetical protein
MPLGAEVEFRLSEGVVQAAVDEALPARTRTLLPPVLFYSAWQTDLPMGDKQLSDGQIPAGVLFQPLGELYADVTLPMAEKGGGEASPFFRYGDGTLRCWAACRYNFTPSVTGILAVSVHEGRDLAQTGVGKMDSYPSVSVGVGDNRELARLDGSVAGRARVAESVARGTVCKEGGDNPMFNHEELLLWVDHEHCSSGSRFVLTLHAEVLGGSVTIGAVSVPVRAWTLDGISHEEVLEATEKRSLDMQNLVADICAAIDLKEFPAPKVAGLFAGGAVPGSKASREGGNGGGGSSQVVVAAAVGGVVGALVASAVILALRK